MRCPFQEHMTQWPFKEPGQQIGTFVNQKVSKHNLNEGLAFLTSGLGSRMGDWDVTMAVMDYPFLTAILMMLWRRLKTFCMHTQAKESFLDTKMKQGQVETSVDCTSE